MRLWLLCQGLTPAAGAGVVGADGDPQAADGRRREQLAAALDRPLARRATVLRSPAAAAAGSAAQLGLATAKVDQALREPDLGTWAGRRLDEIGTDDPDGLAAWLSDPDAAPHGGESVTELVTRVTGWLDRAAAGPDLVAVAGPAVLRAMLVGALRLPASVFWRFDVEPWALLRLTGRSGRWNLRLAAGD